MTAQPVTADDLARAPWPAQQRVRARRLAAVRAAARISVALAEDLDSDHAAVTWLRRAVLADDHNAIQELFEAIVADPGFWVWLADHATALEATRGPLMARIADTAHAVTTAAKGPRP